MLAALARDRLPVRRHGAFFLPLALALGTFLCAEGPAGAQDRLARTHYEAGSSYYDQGRYADALHEFEEAYRLSSRARKPALLYNIGLTQERMGRIEDAIGSFRRYLQGSPQARDRETVTERIRNLQGRLDGTTISLEVSEAEARVQVDGEDRGMTPLAEPLRVTPGRHEIRIEKQGFRSFTLRVTVPAGEGISAEANLVAEAAAPEPDRDPPDPVRDEPTPPPAPRQESGGHTLPWITAGVAAVGAIGTGVFGVMALRKRNAANDAVNGPEPVYATARSDAKRLALVADVCLGVAVVAAGITLVLLLTQGGGDEAEPSEQASLRASPFVLEGGAGLSLAGDL